MLSLVASLVLATPAYAQSVQDQEYRAPELEPTTGKTETSFEFESEYHEFDNLDFRPVDTSSDQAILDSDDRNAFAFTGLAADIAHSPTEDMSLVLSASHRGLWGNDQIGSINAFGGWLYVSSLYVDYAPGAAEDEGLRLRIGRQFFSIGGTIRDDYVLADVVDGVRLDVPVGDIGTLSLLPITVVSASGNVNDVNFFSYIGQSGTQTHGFRGDHLTRRYGGMFVADGLAEGVDARAYAFYTDIGALGTGSDISYNGDLGNFADNDWVANYGLRGGYEKGIFTSWAEFAGSAGVDRKELVAQDVNTIGFAWGAGVGIDDPESEDGPRVHLGYWEAQGPIHTDDGLLYSHGYVSMKGQQTGGLMANRFLGWHPSSYVGMFGIDDDPHDPDRKAGTRVLSAEGGYDLGGPLGFDAGFWFFQDTGVTNLDVGKLEDVVPPYGYSRAEFAAEERLGKTLGWEADLGVSYEVNENLGLYAQGGVLAPGGFYAIQIERVAGDQLGGSAMAVAGHGGARVEF